MARKGFITLVVVTLLVVAGAIAVSLAGRPPAVEANAGQPVLPDLAAKLQDASKLLVRRAKATLTVARGPAGWTIAEKHGYPADPAKVRQALLGLADLKYVEAKTRQPDSYPRLEVEDVTKEGAKSALVEVTDAHGERLAQLIVGKRRLDRLGGGIDGVYVRRPGDPQSWLAQGSLDLAGEPKEWLDKKVVSIPASRVRSVTITQPDGAKLVLQREKAEDKFTVADAAPDSKWKEANLGDAAGALDALELTDVEPADALAEATPGAMAEFVTFDGLTLRTTLAEKDNASWLRLEASGAGAAEKEAAEISARAKGWAYAIPTWKAKNLKLKREDLVEPAKPS